MEINRKIPEIDLGVEKPFSLLHVSDTHLTYADMRDGERKVELGKKRFQYFYFAQDHLDYVKNVAITENKTVVHTGDLIDFVSTLNLEKAKEFIDSADVFMAAGNHEFSLYVGEAKEDSEYKAQTFGMVQSVFKNPIGFASRVINGVNIIVIDNSYYNFDTAQVDALKNEAKKGLPMLLFMHVPLYTEATYDFAMARNAGGVAHIMAVPEEKMSFYSEERYLQQKADALSYETVEYIKNEPMIKAVFTGHIHKDFEDALGKYATQYVTGIGTLREIVIK